MNYKQLSNTPMAKSAKIEWTRQEYDYFRATITFLFLMEAEAQGLNPEQAEAKVAQEFSLSFGSEKSFMDQASLVQKSKDAASAKRLFVSLGKNFKGSFPLSVRFLESIINENPTIRLVAWSLAIGGSLALLTVM